MPFDVLANAAVFRRLRKASKPVRLDFEKACRQLVTRAMEPKPDHPKAWNERFVDLNNHRHWDLRDGWRLCYTIETRNDGPPRVVLVFLGTHREYDHFYGFKPS